MTEHRLIAIALGREFDQEVVRREFGQAFPRWDEPLLINLDNGSKAYVFAFGVVVIVGYRGSREEERIISVLKGAAEAPLQGRFMEEYLWVEQEVPRGRRGYRVTLPTGMVIVRDEAVYGTLDEDALRLLALVLAQSAALRRLEAEADGLLEEVDYMLERLILTKIPRVGGVRIGLLKALRARSTLVGDLLILEKPKAAWEDERYERFYERLRYIFEIEERYTSLSRKLNSILETLEIMTALVNESRFLFLETLIVLFFIVDIILVLLH